MGSTGIRVSEIGFGSGDNAGLLVKGEPEEQLRVIERALELGINYFDTSPDYGKGLAETNIGKAMRAIGFRPVIATKVEVMPDELDHIADAVVESVEDSLTRLQVDYVDIVQIHNPPSIETDTTVPGWLHLGLDDYLDAGGAMEGLERLRRAGKVRFFGFANEDADADAVHTLLETHEFHMLNVWYDLLNPTAGLATPDGLDVQHDYGQFLVRARELGVGNGGHPPARRRRVDGPRGARRRQACARRRRADPEHGHVSGDGATRDAVRIPVEARPATVGCGLPFHPAGRGRYDGAGRLLGDVAPGRSGDVLQRASAVG